MSSEQGKSDSQRSTEPGAVLSSELAMDLGQRFGPYELVRKLGAGGMGVVYLARDTRNGALVALKRLTNFDAAAPLRLKNEFRAVANLAHPNLVSLYELVSDGESWFFTMEYIEGSDLASLMRRSISSAFPVVSPRPANTPAVTDSQSETATLAPEASAASEVETATSARADSASETTASAIVVQAPRKNEVRAGSPEPLTWSGVPQPLLEPEALWRIFRQLALGIWALHRTGTLHCDIKPGNVMVGRNGRVVLLDFGLVTSRARGLFSDGTYAFAGTPAYISPEQVLGEPASEASDWYAFGVILYEALCGRRPFPTGESLRDKVKQDAPLIPASPHVPEVLRKLCMALLRRDASARPTGRQVLEQLGLSAEARDEASESGAQRLVGREEQLDALHQALGTMREGRPVTVFLHGRSGMGKTALAHRFLSNAMAEGVVVLVGRCFERETVPYKAFDGLVDSLVRYLRKLPAYQVEALRPRNMADLLRVFPVLERVSALAVGARPAPAAGAAPDPLELRRRAFRAFKELLARLGEQTPLILFIDDLQWGDLDSASVLTELLSPPEAPRVMVLGGYRSEEKDTSPFLAELHELRSLLREQFDLREVEVGPLDEQSARRLAAALLGTGEDSPHAAELGRESGGNPFFLEELVRYFQASAGAPSVGVVTLEGMLRERVSRLPEGARRLLEVVAVVGRPIPQGLAAQAAESGPESQPSWTLLRSLHLVRTRGIQEVDPAESYHDRIRELVYGALPPETLRGHHLRLGTVMESAGQGEPEVLAFHFRQAGELGRASLLAARAGDHAAAALAFQRAAELYREALESTPDDRSLRVKLADALANAGRCTEAAREFLGAAVGAGAEESLHLRRRAAQQLLMSGHLRDGLATLKPLLAEVGLHYPATPQRALMGVIGRSLQLSMRGMAHRERLEAEVPPALLHQIDVAFAATSGLSTVDVARGVYFNLRCAYLSLVSGEPHRVRRAKAIMGLANLSRATPATIRKGYALLEEAEQSASQHGDAYVVGLSRILRGIGQLVLGELRKGCQSLDSGARLLEEQCVGGARECSTAYINHAIALKALGELRELAERGAHWLHVAEEHGDVLASTVVRINLTAVHLAGGNAEAASAYLAETMSRWQAEEFNPVHLVGVLQQAECELYRGRPEEAKRRLEEALPAAKACYALEWQLYRVQHTYLHAGAALAMAGQRAGPEREALLGVAVASAKRLEREGVHYARGCAALLRGAVAAQAENRAAVLSELEKASARFDEAELVLHAACARRHGGVLLGGEEGGKAVESANAILRGQGILDGARWAAMVAPGYPGA